MSPSASYIKSHGKEWLGDTIKGCEWVAIQLDLRAIDYEFCFQDQVFYVGGNEYFHGDYKSFEEMLSHIEREWNSKDNTACQL